GRQVVFACCCCYWAGFAPSSGYHRNIQPARNSYELYNATFWIRYKQLQHMHMMSMGIMNFNFEVLKHLKIVDSTSLRLENESCHAYLTMLQFNVDKPALAKDVEVETRLVELCEDVLTCDFYVYMINS
ncbi:unnamed protein product, partial [Calypogeia fissa]